MPPPRNRIPIHTHFFNLVSILNIHFKNRLAMDEFRYTSLPQSGRPFRLARLEAKSPNGLGTVRVTLFDSDLDKKPTFTALSYVWGSPPGMTEILVNGHGLKIPVNLDRFLRQLRNMCEMHTPPSNAFDVLMNRSNPATSEVILSIPFIFWADSISINQTDFLEKNQQIPLMRDIYGSSERTISWVGEKTDFSNQAINHLYNLAENRDLPYERRWTSHRIITNAPAWNALQKFCELQYWNRIWILQEFILPKEVVIMCGNRTLNIDKLHVAFGTWKDCYWQLVEGGTLPDHVLDCTPDRIESFLEQRLLYGQTQWEGDEPPERIPDDADHLRILITTGGLCSTDPRDKLYGLSGVTTLGLDCDYALSTKQTYVTFAGKQIDMGFGNIMIRYSGVGALDDHQRTCPLPSWVPDWNSILKPQPQSRLARRNFWSEDPWKVSLKFSDCFQVKASNPDRLLVRAVEYATIAKVHRWQSDLARDWNFWTYWPIRTADQCPYLIPQLQAVLRTLLMYDDWWTVHFPDLSYKYALAFILILQKMPSLQSTRQAWMPADLEALRDIEGVLRNLTWDQPGATEARVKAFFIGNEKWNKPRRVLPKSPEGDEKLIKNFLEEIAINIGHRSFFWTEEGLFGIAPRRSQPGDRIFFSAHGKKWSFCFLVRKAGDHFVNVGSAYVFGQKVPGFVDALDEPDYVDELEIV